MAQRESKGLEWVRPPQQARSAQTLERLLDAAESLIVEQGVEATSVAQVAQLARSSVGAIYARFPDKEALIRSVFERFAAQSRATMDSVLEPARWQGVSLHEAMRQLLRFLLRVTRERHLLVTSLMAQATRDVTAAGWLDGLAVHLSACAYRLLDARGELPERPDPAVAVGALAGALLSVAESRMLRPRGMQAPLTDAQLAQELTHMALAVLGAPPEVRGS